MTTIFISHRNNAKDNAWAAKIHDFIKEENGIAGFLDFNIESGLLFCGCKIPTAANPVFELGEDLVNSRFFREGVKSAFDNISKSGDKQRFISEVAFPLSRYGSRYFDFEKRTGRIGAHANPLSWQDGVWIKTVGGEHEGLLLEIDEASVTILFDDGEENTNLEVPLDAIETVDWVSRSVGAQEARN